MSAALAIIGLTALGALLLGLRASRGRDMSLEQWTVGGRGFGAVFVFLLMAGEIYTTFTFLGGSGYAYGHGGPTHYILAYGCLAYVISYWMLPPIWRYARQHKLISQPDYFAARYDSPALGVRVAVVGVVALVPYLVFQFKGLGIIVATASYGAIPPSVAIWSSAGVFAGIVAGIATVAATSLPHTTITTLFPALPEALRGLNIGIVALALNVLNLTVISAFSRRMPSTSSA